MEFNTLFLIYFALFLLLLLYGGWITRKWVNDSSDYLLAGREVSLLINTFGIAAIGFAGTIITLGPGLALTNGFWGSFGFGFAYLFGGLALYGLVFAPYIRRCGAHTLPEWLEMRFDSRTRLLVTITTVLGLLGIMANNVVSMAIVVTGFTNWSLIWTLTAIFVVFLLFTYIGGFWAVTLTDFVQMCIGLIALPLLLFSLISVFGGPDFLVKNWPSETSLWTHGITGEQLPLFSWKYPSLLTFVILFSCFLVWGNNYYWLRVSSTRSERTAKWSFVYAAILLAVVPYLALTLTGLYAGAAFPDTFAPMGEVSPMAAFGVVLKALPISVAAFALIGALAASISTSTTALIGASSTAVRDIYQRHLRPDAHPKELTTTSKVITVALGLLVWLLCFYPGGPLYLFAFSTAWLGPPSVLVLLGMWWRRTTKTGAFYGALLGIVVTAILSLLELLKIFSIEKYTHVGVVGLFVTLITTVVVSLVTEPQYYGLKSWKLKGKSEDAVLDVSKEEKEILALIASGYHTMAEVSDMMGLDSAVNNRMIERLDQKRLIVRKNYVGPGFYTFQVTPEGMRLIDEKRFILFQEQVNLNDLVVLQKVKEGVEAFRRHVQENRLDSLRVSVILSKLIRLGFLTEGGIWRRTIRINEKGNDLLQKYHHELKGIDELKLEKSSSHNGE